MDEQALLKRFFSLGLRSWRTPKAGGLEGAAVEVVDELYIYNEHISYIQHIENYLES